MPAEPPPGTPSRADRELAAHLENTPLAVIEWDADFRVVRWTGQAEAIFGWPAAEVVGKRPADWRLVHDDDAVAVERLMREIAALRRPRSVLVNRNYTRAGAVVWCEWHNSILLDDAGRLVSILSLVLDVTERKAAVEASARSEARLRTALAAAGMIGWEWNLAANRGAMSADFAAFHGLPPEVTYDSPAGAEQTVHPDDMPAVRRAAAGAIAEGGEFQWEYRGRVPAADGGERWFATRGQVFPGPDGRPARLVGVTADVTDRKRAEAERGVLNRRLADAQRWEGLGVMAGGIAHDFNNILTVVLGSAALARRTAGPGSPADAHLDEIELSCDRAARLCRQMLAYAGRGCPPAGRADLSRVVGEAAPLLTGPAGGQVTVRLDLAADLPQVRADPGLVRQVLVNLVTNAAEASRDGRPVTVRTAAAEVRPDDPTDGFRLPPWPGRYAVLEVADVGEGMTPEVRDRMFDPFFSTRFPGRGLGLAAVLGIVRSHRGGIAVDTAAGRGTTIRVLWPADDPRPAAVPADRPGRGVALVADADPFRREVVAATLENQGYEAVVAGTGAEGLELYDQRRDELRVAVVDVDLPGATGCGLLDVLHHTDPDMPLVVLIGPTGEPPPAAGRAATLRRPFRPEELAAAVRHVTGG
ncbi:MAG: PAS domain S-box protein [Gemmataceae bacterium]|nr:PAS domain S-box protein [Gemmataceae bacterium]